MNHPWFLAPLAYTDLWYSLDLCDNWETINLYFTFCVVFHLMYVYANKQIKFELEWNQAESTPTKNIII